MKEKFIDFEKCAKALYMADKNIGKKIVWPFINVLDIYIYSSTLASELYSIFENANEPASAFAEKIRSPSSLWKLISFSINGMRNAPEKWGGQRREFVIGKMLSVIHEKVEDLYYEKGDNLLKLGFDKEQLEETPLERLDGLGELKASIWLYTESIYYMMHDLGAVMHGPYVFNNKKYLIHDFYDLKPTYLWPNAEYFEKLSFNSVRIISQYSDVGVCFDTFNNYYTTTDISKPEKAWLFIDNTPADDEQFRAVLNTTKEATLDAYNASMALDNRGRAEKKIETVWAVLKPWKDLVGKKDWKPSNMQEMLNSSPIKKKYENIGFLKKFNVSIDAIPTGEQKINKN